jgi:hypothetical protein
MKMNIPSVFFDIVVLEGLFEVDFLERSGREVLVILLLI